MKGDSANILYQSLLREAILISSAIGRDVHRASLLPTTASPTLQGALKDGFGEAVAVCDMPEPCEFPPLGNRQKEVPVGL